jgi:hypothetical protein
MRVLKIAARVAVCVLFMSPLVAAERNMYGVANRRDVRFETPVRIAEGVLPPGKYRVVHTMSADSHIMVFTQLGVAHGAQLRATCHLVPLNRKADKNRQIYIMNSASERVLTILVFKGDRAQHEF